MKVVQNFFSKIEKEKWSGEIEVTSSQGNASILVYEGQLLWVHRPLDRAIERWSKIAWLQIPSSQKIIQARSWEDLVLLLLQENSTQRESVIQHLKIDRLELFFRIFFWVNVELTPRAFRVSLPDQTALGFYTLKKFSNLLTEAQKRMKEWPRIQNRMGSSKRFFIAQVDLPPDLDSSDDAIDKAIHDFDKTGSSLIPRLINHIPYSREEIEIIRACNGRFSVQDIVRQSTDGEFLTLRRMVQLWKKGVIRPKDDEDTVTHSHIRAIRFHISDFLSLVLASLVTFCGWLLIAHLSRQYNGPAMGMSELKARVPEEIIEILDLYRAKEGHYPLTIQELETSEIFSPSGTTLLKEELKHFRYILLQPYKYEIEAMDPEKPN